MNAIDAAMLLIAHGIIEVRANGEIWRLRRRNSLAVTWPIEPRRLDERLAQKYFVIRLTVDGRTYVAYSHRVVWTHVNGHIPEGMDINHLDGVKTNNAPENLELATRSQNHLHAYRTGLRVPCLDAARRARRERLESR